MEHTLTDEQLAEQLHSLSASIDKGKFWYESLGLDYVLLYDSDLFKGRDLNQFKFSVPKEEQFEFNLWLLERLAESSVSNQRPPLLDLGTLSSDWEIKISEAEDGKALIQNELKSIDLFFEGEKQRSFQPYKFRSGFGGFRFGQIYDADFKTYFDYKDYRQEVDWSQVYSLVYNVRRAANGSTLAKFREFLLEKLEALTKPQEKETTDISLDQRLLMLHYLGALEKVREAGNATKQAIFLSLIIKNDKDRIRQRFSSILDLFEPKEKAKREKLKKDLQLVASQFEELGLKNIVKKIQTDLRKLG